MAPVRAFLVAATALVVSGCGNGEVPPRAPRLVPSPAAPGSRTPNLAVGLDGHVYLSWIEPKGEGHALRFSTWKKGAWDAPRIVAEGDDWFVNWADFPSMAALTDGTLAAHWLVRSGEGTYAYDVRVAVSRDGGETWSEPSTPHRDATATEHGFVSVVPSSEGNFDVIWLDGRQMVLTPPGAMTLRHAELQADGTVGSETAIDPSVCDCCSTDAVRTGSGTLLAVYRDRTADEIRDISVSVREPTGWSAPRSIHADGWKIAACPVNGPAVAAAGDDVVVAWFTESDDLGKVQVAFSNDGGRTVHRTWRVDEGNPVGRVDVVMLDGASALACWLERDGDLARIALRRVGPDGISATTFVATTSPARSSGFPRLAAAAGEVILAWTQGGDPSTIATAVIAP